MKKETTKYLSGQKHESTFHSFEVIFSSKKEDKNKLVNIKQNPKALRLYIHHIQCRATPVRHYGKQMNQTVG